MFLPDISGHSDMKLLRRMINVGRSSAIREFGAVLWDFGRWARLAWTDISLRYRRTLLGPWWLTLSTGAMLGSVGLVWSSIFGTEISTYLPFFGGGIIFWTYLSSSLIEGCNVFIQAAPLIKSTPTRLVLHVFRMVTRHLIVLAHNLSLMLMLWIVFQWPVGWSLFLVVPGVAIVTIVLVGAVLTLGILCTRFRDIQQVIAVLLQLLFLLTPILWMPDSLRGKATRILVDLNPLNHLIEIVRGPLLGQPPPAYVWLWAAGCAMILLIIGLVLYDQFRHRVAYWL